MESNIPLPVEDEPFELVAGVPEEEGEAPPVESAPSAP
jgi:hypothetical protein